MFPKINRPDIVRSSHPKMNNGYVQAVVSLARDGLGMSRSAVATLALRAVQEQNQAVDIIQAALNDYIDRYRSLSFENFSLDVRVRPSEQGRPIGMEFGKISFGKIGVDMYRFVAAGHLRRRIMVRPIKGDMLILYNGHWQPVEAYLDALKVEPAIRTVTDDENRAVSWWRQENWWRSNGKAFRFLDLPAELRDVIYQFALVKPAQPYPRMKSRKMGYAGQVKMTEANPTTALMRINYQVHTEASHVFYRDAPFVMSHKQVLGKVITNPLLASNICHLHLSLSHAGYLQAFGFRFNDILDYSNPYGGPVTALREMRLATLEIEIAAPSNVAEEAWLDSACQRSICGWIFEAMWPAVKGHPFSFTGYIKDSQKAAFEAYGAQESEVVAEWQRRRVDWGFDKGTLSQYDEFVEGWESDGPGGVRLDGREGEGDEWMTKRPEVREDVKDGSQNIPGAPICFCRTVCSAENWSFQD